MDDLFDKIMDRLLWTVLLVCVLALARFLYFAGSAAKAVKEQAVTTLASVDQSSQKVAKDIDDLKVMLNATLFQVGDASHEVAETAREQKKYWDQTGQQTVLAMKQLNDVLAQAKSTVADFDTSQVHITEAVVSTTAQLNDTLKTSRATLDSATQAVHSLNVMVANPSITNTFQHLDTMSLELQGTSQDIHKAVHDWTKPKSIAKSILSFLLDTSSKVAVIFK